MNKKKLGVSALIAVGIGLASYKFCKNLKKSDKMKIKNKLSSLKGNTELELQKIKEKMDEKRNYYKRKITSKINKK